MDLLEIDRLCDRDISSGDWSDICLGDVWEGDMNITIRIKSESPSHTVLSIWINHGLSGTLILRNDEVEDMIRLLKPEKIWDTDGIEIANIPS